MHHLRKIPTLLPKKKDGAGGTKKTSYEYNKSWGSWRSWNSEKRPRSDDRSYNAPWKEDEEKPMIGTALHP